MKTFFPDFGDLLKKIPAHWIPPKLSLGNRNHLDFFFFFKKTPSKLHLTLAINDTNLNMIQGEKHPLSRWRCQPHL